MSYYRLDGVSGVFATPDMPIHESIKTWRWLVASFLVLLGIGFSGAAYKVFASIEQAQVLPKASAASQPSQPAQPSVPAVVIEPPEVDSKLQKELETWAASISSDWAFYVQSLDGGDVKAELNATKQYQMASIYKLFLLKPLAGKLPAEAWATTNISDRTYLACVQAMLAVSDNPCGEAIAGNLGWSFVHKQNTSYGYKSTVLNDSNNFVSSPSDTGLLLDRLYHGDGYDAKTKSIVLEALGKKKSAEAIRKACTDCTVYNKTGDLNGNKHDAAIVEKNGKAYVVVIFSSGASWPQLTEAAGIVSNRL